MEFHEKSRDATIRACCLFCPYKSFLFVDPRFVFESHNFSQPFSRASHRAAKRHRLKVAALLAGCIFEIRSITPDLRKVARCCDASRRSARSRSPLAGDCCILSFACILSVLSLFSSFSFSDLPEQTSPLLHLEGQRRWNSRKQTRASNIPLIAFTNPILSARELQLRSARLSLEWSSLCRVTFDVT